MGFEQKALEKGHRGTAGGLGRTSGCRAWGSRWEDGCSCGGQQGEWDAAGGTLGMLGNNQTPGC